MISIDKIHWSFLLSFPCMTLVKKIAAKHVPTWAKHLHYCSVLFSLCQRARCSRMCFISCRARMMQMICKISGQRRYQTSSHVLQTLSFSLFKLISKYCTDWLKCLCPLVYWTMSNLGRYDCEGDGSNGDFVGGQPQSQTLHAALRVNAIEYLIPLQSCAKQSNNADFIISNDDFVYT